MVNQKIKWLWGDFLLASLFGQTGGLYFRAGIGHMATAMDVWAFRERAAGRTRMSPALPASGLLLKRDQVQRCNNAEKDDAYLETGFRFIVAVAVWVIVVIGGVHG